VNIVRKKENFFREVCEMKKLILVLAIALIASPAFALTVQMVYEGGTSNIVDVTYSGADSGNLPRAFGLDVQIQSGVATVSSVDNYLSGESNSVHPGFGIYPARIDINTAGIVQSWGSPLADTADPGSGSALPSQHIVLEFASLYYADANKPNTSGTLCKLNLAPGLQTAAYNIKMSAETTYRGGVVLTDGTQFAMPDSIITIPATATAPGQATNPSPANLAVGINPTGTTLSWTAGSGSPTSHDVYFGTVSPGTFIGNQAGTTYAPAMVQGKTYYWRIDEKNAAGTTTGVVWSFNAECLKSTAPEYSDWVLWGRPSCWCYQRHCRGDINGTKNLQWVQLLDLNALKAAYQKNDTLLGGITNGICADINHTKNLQRVQLLDLNILKSYYQKNDTLTPVCPATNYNFWTN
jgi:hypothetical protein